MINKKALSLLSGGLDSVIAARLILEQGVEVIGLHFVSSFCDSKRKERDDVVVRSASELGIRVLIRDKGPGYVEVVTKPKHGYGKNMNPCIDCRIYMLQEARRVMEAEGASFLVTGEVVGQRPMSQMRDTIRLIEKESGLTGLIVRPLSAKLLAPSEAESQGIVDRSQFLDIAGRSRKVQYELVERYNIKEFSKPAGGCLLTDPIYAKKLRELLKEEPEFTMADIDLLKYGRHFRFCGVKLVVGRDKDENEALYNLWSPPYLLARAGHFKGPSAILKGPVNDNTIAIAGNIISFYAKNEVFPFVLECFDGQTTYRSISRILLDPEEYKVKSGL
jgi:tRNA U34 2-thiouridine synthase MnmA/TrmU